MSRIQLHKSIQHVTTANGKLSDKTIAYRFHPESSKFDRLTSQTAPAQNIFTLSDGDTWVFQTDGRLLRITPDESTMTCRQILDNSYGVRRIIKPPAG